MSPTATLVTAEPISCTQPAFSWPIVYGSGGPIACVPLALDDVQVGAAHPGAADPDDHVERTLDRRLGHLLDDRVLVVAVQPDRPHRLLLLSRRAETGASGVAGAQHAAAHAAVGLDADPGQPGPPQVQRQRRHADRRPGRGSISSGASSPAGSPSSARRRRAAARRSGDGGTAPSVSSARSSAVRPAASSGRHTRSVPASTALRRKSARSSSSSPAASPSNDADEARPGRPPRR